MGDAGDLPEAYSFKPKEDKPVLDNSWGLTDCGTATYTNGDTYTGDFVEGKKHGHGVYLFRNGDEYEGPYNDNLRDGIGQMKFVTGARYNGNFSKGQKHGEGTYFYANGDVYCGQWDNNERHGEGTYVVRAGAKEGVPLCKCSYEGTWERGQFKKGAYGLGEKVFTGVFSQQKPLGEGEWTIYGSKVHGVHKHQELPVDNAPDDLTLDPSQEVRVTWETHALTA